MSLETDLLIDRRRLKRRLLFWRIAAVAAVVACAVLIFSPDLPRDHVTRLTIEGTITDTSREVTALDAMAKDSSAKALILRIDSPGGGVYASEQLHDAIARVAERKPVVAVMGATAASGGFMIAMAAKHIVAGTGTLTGSIGVILQTQEISGLLAKVGVTSEALTSGPLKDQPSLTHPLSEAGRALLHGVVADMYEQFVAIVATGRHMDPARVRDLADGRVLTGRQALAAGLVDEIGDENSARAWLAATSSIPVGMPARELRTRSRTERMVAASLTPLSGALKTVLYQGLGLDEAQVLWHPSVGE